MANAAQKVQESPVPYYTLVLYIFYTILLNYSKVVMGGHIVGLDFVRLLDWDYDYS